ncbi:MAG TPA: TIGR03621 family F420-dependent LLM class oxidoreductase [Jiangellales bacterium]|nr:TIGR03621 family F420-dependent LLM class oxidoreductase [Jiangellales bacterium]
MRQFRFGVVGESVGTSADLVDSARRAEDLGYDTLLLRDHFVAEPFGHQLAPLIALTAAAGATSRLRVGTLVLANDYRHPVLLAKEAATLDVLSGGRLELGLGAGWLSAEYAAAGLTFDPAGDRVSRLEESIRLLKALFEGGPVTFEGRHYQISGLDSFPRPAQRPHPPLLVGAGSRRMLGLAGRHADIVGILPKALPNGTISEDISERTPATTAQKVAWIREGAGDRFARVELSMMISPVIAADHHGAAEQFAAERGWGPGLADLVLEMPSAFIGSVERITELMLARREEYGFSYYVVSDRAMQEFAPVVTKLAAA